MKALLLILLLADPNEHSALQTNSSGDLTVNGNPLTKLEATVQSRVEVQTAPELMRITKDYLLRHGWMIDVCDSPSFYLRSTFARIGTFNTEQTTAEFYFQNITHVAGYNSAVVCVLKFSGFLPKVPRGSYVSDATTVPSVDTRAGFEATEAAYASIFDGIENRR